MRRWYGKEVGLQHLDIGTTLVLNKYMYIETTTALQKNCMEIMRDVAWIFDWFDWNGIG